MASAHADTESALYAPCAAVHSAGARLLLRVQANGTARADMDGVDLFALMSALGWLAGQPSFAPRAYESDWRIFTHWCQTMDLAALPAAPTTVAMFLAAQAKHGTAPST